MSPHLGLLTPAPAQAGLSVLLAGHCRSPIRPPFVGGLEAITWHLARGLHARGHRVAVFAAEGSDCGPGVAVLTPEDLGVTIAPDAPWVESRDDISLAYARLSTAARSLDVDLVHNNSLNRTLLDAGVPVPLVTTLHTPPLLPMLDAFRRRGAAAGAVTAVSEHTASAWQPVVQAEVVHNGVDTELWRPGPGGVEWVWFGRLVPEKGPDVAIEMARRLGVPLRLAGPVSDRAFFEQAIAPRLGGAVEYVGHLDTPDLARLVGASAAALVTPQWDEPFGLIAAESAACGTPVVGLARGGLPEVVDEATGRLVDPQQWEDGLARAAAEASALDREQVRRRAVDRFALGRMVDAYQERYLQLVRGGTPRAVGDRRTPRVAGGPARSAGGSTA